MGYRQREVVILKQPHKLPDGTELFHPFLIISCDRANSKEKHYSGVMMTASKHTDGFTFNIDNSMFERPLGKEHCQIRLYIIASFREIDIREIKNRMLKIHFQALIQQITTYTLSIDNT